MSQATAHYVLFPPPFMKVFLYALRTYYSNYTYYSYYSYYTYYSYYSYFGQFRHYMYLYM